MAVPKDSHIVAGGTPYEEHAPPPSLRRILLCPWSLCVDSDDHTQLVLPDGCVDIVFIGWSPPIIAGPATRPSTVRLARGTIVVGARFRPGWAPAGLGVAASELRDRDAVPLEEAWGPRAGWLHERVARRTSAHGKVQELSHCLDRPVDANGAVDPVVDACVRALAGEARVRDLERTAGPSARHPRRRFAVAVGYGMKTSRRIVRFQRAPGAPLRPVFGEDADGPGAWRQAAKWRGLPRDQRDVASHRRRARSQG